MKEYKNIDELFKDGMAGLTTEPSAGVWKNIEAGFFQGQGFVWKWYHVSALALLLILAGGSVWYFSKDFQNTDANSPEISTTNETHQEQPNTQIIVEQQSDAGTSSQEQKESETNLITGPNELFSETIDDQVSPEAQKEDLIAEQPLSSGFYENEDNIRKENINTLSSTNIDMEDDLPETSIDPIKVPGLQEYLKKQKHTHFYTGASGHAGMVYYPSTKDQFTWSADLTFGLKVGKFFAETGVGYESMQERGIYLIELRGYDSIGYYNQVQSFVIDPHSPNEIIYNTKEVTVYDSVDHYTHTAPLFKYNYVNIPLVFGYRFLEKKKFTVSVNTGIIFNFLTSKEIPESDYYSSDYTVVQTKNVTPERVDWNMRWQLGLRMNYHIAGSLSISAEPLFTKYLNSIYDTNKGYDNVKPYTMGVKIGIFYGF